MFGTGHEIIDVVHHFRSAAFIAEAISLTLCPKDTIALIFSGYKFGQQEKDSYVS